MSAIRSRTGRSISTNLSLDYGPSDRDIRHKFNFFTYVELPQHFLVNVRTQGRTAQPHSTPRVLNATDRGRNWDRKDNKFFSLDWRLQRAFRVGARTQIVPSVEMFKHVQQQKQRDPAHDTGVVQLRRVPAAGRRRSTPGSAGGEGHVLTSEKGAVPLFTAPGPEKGVRPFFSGI